MWRKWFPWRRIVKAVARRQGFLDPVALLSKLQRFAQPSEVAAPVELIRLATVLQARGLVNVQAIQHNLDWIWPYWVVRQFNPRDPSFIPRAFSLTHINLTHRNWTAVGIPDFSGFPIVDPRGLLTPFYDGWSLDAWILSEEGDLLPSHAPTAAQKWEFDEMCLHTEVHNPHASLATRVSVQLKAGEPICVLKINAAANSKSWLAVSLRPYNPEGVSEVESVAILENGAGWEINKKQHVYFSEAPDGQFLSEYQEGDVYRKLRTPSPLPSPPRGRGQGEGVRNVQCKAGMATACAIFPISESGRQIEVQIPFKIKNAPRSQGFIFDLGADAEQSWRDALKGHCELHLHDQQAQYLYDAAVRALILHTPGTEVFPGPYTYKHFWFRDACFILHALLAANLWQRAEKILDSFPGRQNPLTGYFCSQEGEWDSNGQVLWIFRRFCELTKISPKESWKEAIRKGAAWIEKKRLPESLPSVHSGLFPAGFSAEHLGPNDYYYWDDFWGAGGLLSAASLMTLYGEEQKARHYRETAGRFMKCIETSLARVAKKLNTVAMPASPHRRLDTGAVGSLAVGYPLNLWAADDPRVLQTVRYLLKNHFINGGFFHEMSHSGMNPYLTLAIAQVLLRNGDPRFADIFRSLQKLASPTGQWPEAVHPQTLGGCMGDGQHIWAAAEWVLMIRNCFVREEDGRLILCSGVLSEWYVGATEISFGKTPTPYGNILVRLRPEGTKVRVSWEAEWYGNPPAVEVWLPGYQPVKASGSETTALLSSCRPVPVVPGPGGTGPV